MISITVDISVTYSFIIKSSVKSKTVQYFPENSAIQLSNIPGILTDAKIVAPRS
jgi:hypothetical protein